VTQKDKNMRIIFNTEKISSEKGILENDVLPIL